MKKQVVTKESVQQLLKDGIKFEVVGYNNVLDIVEIKTEYEVSETNVQDIEPRILSNWLRHKGYKVHNFEELKVVGEDAYNLEVTYHGEKKEVEFDHNVF